MLVDRRILLEKEIKKAKAAASAMYLDIVINDGDPTSEDYQQLKGRVNSLTFDLAVVNELIDKGVE